MFSFLVSHSSDGLTTFECTKTHSLFYFDSVKYMNSISLEVLIEMARVERQLQ